MIVVRTIMQPFHKKSCNFSIFLKTFLVLLERAIWHILQSMWCSQGSVFDSRNVFFLWGCKIFCVERLHNLCVVERLHNFSPSLTHSGCIINFSEGCMIFFLRRGCMIFVQRLRVFFVWRSCVFFVCEEVARFFVWKCFFSEKKSSGAKKFFWSLLSLLSLLSILLLLSLQQRWTIGSNMEPAPIWPPEL